MLHLMTAREDLGEAVDRESLKWSDCEQASTRREERSRWTVEKFDCRLSDVLLPSREICREKDQLNEFRVRTDFGSPEASRNTTVTSSASCKLCTAGKSFDLIHLTCRFAY